MLRRTRRRPGDPPPLHYVVDRRMPEECWLIDGPVHLSTQATNWFTEVVGERGPGQFFRHLCETFGETNRCIRPEHIVIASRAENVAHMHALRAAAGVPWRGGRQPGDSFPEKTCPHCGGTYRFEGAHRKKCRA